MLAKHAPNAFRRIRLESLAKYGPMAFFEIGLEKQAFFFDPARPCLPTDVRCEDRATPRDYLSWLSELR